MAPLRIEPDFGKRSENEIQPPSSDRSDVLSEDVAASQTHSGGEHIEPESASGSPCDASAFARATDVLARKAAAEDVGPSDVGDVSDIGPDAPTGRKGAKAPLLSALSQYAGCRCVPLNEQFRAMLDAKLVKCEPESCVEAADSAECADDVERCSHIKPSFRPSSGTYHNDGRAGARQA